MPRSVTGVYTLPLPPVVAGTLILAEWANPTLDDLGDTLTDSLDRYGRGAMLAPLRVPSGTVTAPSLSFTSEPSSGLYLKGAGEVGFGIANSLIATWKAAGLTFEAGKEVLVPTVPSTGNALVNKTYADSLVSGGPFLPLAGGTLTGGLIGTTAAFSGAVSGTTGTFTGALSSVGATLTGTVTLPSTTSIGTVSDTEISYLDGVTSAIQTQFTGKASLSGAAFTGAVSVAGAYLTITTDGYGLVTASGSRYYDSGTVGIWNGGPSTVKHQWYFNGVGPKLTLYADGSLAAAGSITATGTVYFGTGTATGYFAGSIATLGNASNVAHCQIDFQNTNRSVQLYFDNSGESFGLYDFGLGNWRFRTNSSGDFIATGNVTAYSDARVKENVRDFALTPAQLAALRLVEYDRTDRGCHEVGVIAQEVEAIAPWCVVTDHEGHKSVDYGRLAVMIALSSHKVH